MGFKYRLPHGNAPDPTRTTPAPRFTSQYNKFHRVWAEVLRDALYVIAEDPTVPAAPRALVQAVLEGYDAGRAKWCPEALLKATDGDD